jgi:hypothetical protein
METVSEKMRYYKINTDALRDNNYWVKLVNDIRNSLSKQPSLDNKILVIKLQDVVNDDVTMIPKLEYHEENV